MTRKFTILAAALAVAATTTLAQAEQRDQHTDRYFKFADQNGDGKISLSEAGQLRAKRFARMDKNGDGIIAKDEIHAGQDDNPSREERLQRLFDRIDADKDGAVTRDEWNDKGKQSFNQADSNGDGFITKDEIAIRWREHKRNNQAN